MPGVLGAEVRLQTAWCPWRLQCLCISTPRRLSGRESPGSCPLCQGRAPGRVAPPAPAPSSRVPQSSLTLALGPASSCLPDPGPLTQASKYLERILCWSLLQASRIQKRRLNRLLCPCVAARQTHAPPTLPDTCVVTNVPSVPIRRQLPGRILLPPRRYKP